MGAKAIGVFGGLDLHGAPRAVTWSKLAATVSPGAHQLTLARAVDWAVGEHIVVATTSYRSAESEKRTIAAISEDGRTITVDAAFQYKHIGTSSSSHAYA